MAKGDEVACEYCGETYKQSIGFQRFCSDRCGQLSWRSRNAPKWRAKNKARSKEQRHVEYQKRYLKRTYGISYEKFLEMSAKQGDVCAICGSPPIDSHYRLSVDHVKDSDPPIIRGLLCTNCNMAIGGLRHNPAIAMAAAKYLREAEIFG